MQRGAGRSAAALTSYQASSRSASVWPQADPGNAGWQRDLIVSCVKLAEADPAVAPTLLACVRSRHCDATQNSGRLSPADAWMPRDLARRLAELTK